MKRSKRLLSAIIVFCFIVSCFSPIQIYALEQETAASSQPTGLADKSTDQKDGTPGQTVKNSTEKSKGQTAEQTTGPAIKTTVNPDTVKKDAANTPAVKAEAKKAPDDESLWYRKKLPMKKEHQKLLWDYCKKRNLNYIDILALIYTESNFYEKCKSGSYYGYFQISKGNCADLAKTLKTKNKPLDGAININWGTAFYSWILADKRTKGLTGKKQRDVALSIYQRGSIGYDKSGISTRFLKNYYKKRGIVCSWFGMEG